VALDRETGDIVWKHSRPGRHSYATSLLIDVDGVSQIISPAADRVTSYDAQTGEPIWWVTYKGYSLIPRPVFGNGLVYICTGYETASLLAIKPSGRGDVTSTHVAWKSNRGIPFTPSPVLVEDELFLVSDAGIASCLDAQSGKLHWKERLGGNFSASPIAADGRIYFLSESGTAIVIRQSTQFEKLAVNDLSGRTFASPAVVGTALIVRSDSSLYRIEETAME